MELFFFGRAGKRLDRGGTALNDGGDVVEVTGADFLLVRDKGLALIAGGEFLLLHHQSCFDTLVDYCQYCVRCALVA